MTARQRRTELPVPRFAVDEPIFPLQSVSEIMRTFAGTASCRLSAPVGAPVRSDCPFLNQPISSGALRPRLSHRMRSIVAPQQTIRPKCRYGSISAAPSYGTRGCLTPQSCRADSSPSRQLRARSESVECCGGTALAEPRGRHNRLPARDCRWTIRLQRPHRGANVGQRNHTVE
jgi:hypothetical protein